MNLFRRFLAVLAVTLGAAGPALAVTGSTDFTDLWYNPTENGWGINFAQQGNVIFATMFVYGADNTPRWYVASGMTSQPANSGQFKFGGSLYSTVGTNFATVPYNPSQFTVTEVGAMAVTFTGPSTATLVYNVGNTTVTKNIVRQTFASNNIAGNYIGGLAAQQSGCTGVSNGPVYFIGGTVTLAVAQTASAVTLQVSNVSSSNVTCNFAGTYAQDGRLGKVTNGTWSCVSPTQVVSSGTFALSEVDVQVNHLSAVFTGSDSFCTSIVGRIGGIRNVQ